VRQGTKVVLIPLPPAVGRAIDQAIGIRTRGPILLNSRAARMDRYAATRRLRRLAEAAGARITRAHPHMLRHTFVTTMPGARIVLHASRSPPVTPTHEPRCVMTGPARTWTATRTTSWRPTWPPAPDQPRSSAASARQTPGIAE
jgi:integrase/recombinase XerD